MVTSERYCFPTVDCNESQRKAMKDGDAFYRQKVNHELAIILNTKPIFNFCEIKGIRISSATISSRLSKT